jgi:hypothetical protein
MITYLLSLASSYPSTSTLWLLLRTEVILVFTLTGWAVLIDLTYQVKLNHTTLAGDLAPTKTKDETIFGAGFEPTQTLSMVARWRGY